MPDLVWKHFGYGQLWPLWPACSQIGLDHVYARSNFLHPIRFHSCKEGPDHTVQNRPRSNLDGLVRLGPDGSGPETSQCARIIGPSSGRMQLACYQFPTFRLGCILPQMAQTILCTSSLDVIWFWLTVSGFGPMDPVRKQAGVQESLSLLLANVSEPIRIRCKSDPARLLG